MNYSNDNQTKNSLSSNKKKFGIRVTLPAADTLRDIIGDNWEKFHWYETEAERDFAYDKMSEHHGYYRDTDAPTQVLEKISA
ncbi:MAG: hypothetical protein CMO97_01480 [Woeseia sp.]|jgi:hypothetical protein|nr:hypothetical protein [Woeseia sp.]|tara:strand:- start:314 stop:559 length:246 start_codon:yes stop_codon:yes gene_type:complete